MAEDKRRSLELFDDIRHSESFSRAGYSKQGHIADPLLEGLAKTIYRLRLVAGGLVSGFKTEFHLRENNQKCCELK